MKKYLGIILTVLIVITGVTLGIVFNNQVLSAVQKDTLITLIYICAGSALYCFVVGELTLNNSQMDKLWSIIPLAYVWVTAFKSGFELRVIIMAILVTIWGIRLTINFGRKGAYSIKFWSGEEDYRWIVLRKNPLFKPRWKWALFDLFFISIYQNALVLAICLPAIAVMGSSQKFNYIDVIAIILVAGFILLETIADEQQMRFHTKKRQLLNEGKKLEELPEPYNKGFNTTGLWGHSRHPNYFSEQAIWICLYIFVIAAKVCNYYVFNWSIVGCLVLVLLFLGSSAFGESVSNSKYPEYQNYLNKVSKYVPWKKYRP